MKEYSNEILEEDGYVVEEGCFAKVMEGSVWDDMNSDKINTMFKDTKKQMRKFKRKYSM